MTLFYTFCQRDDYINTSYKGHKLFETQYRKIYIWNSRKKFFSWEDKLQNRHDLK